MRILLLLFFFLSGACGLIYEVVWTKLLTLVIGSTTYSIATVLVAFMGGLALGSYIGGRIIDRKGNPLLIYGILEGMVGLYCLLVPALVRSFEPLFAFFYNRYYTDQFLLFSLARFVICALILLVPTTMMGATLPILSKFFVRRSEQFGWGVGRLYALNTFGAVVGSFASGFVLLPILGKWLTIVSAASANLLICAIVMAYWFFIERRSNKPDDVGAIHESPLREMQGDAGVQSRQGVTPLQMPAAVVWVVLLAYAANGFAGMSYQIAWTRALTLSFGSSAYSFSLILTVFILGLAFGSGVGARAVDRLKNPVAVFGWIEVLIGFSAIGAMYGLGRLPVWMVWVMVRFMSNWNTLLVAQFTLVFGLIFLPTFLMGMAFPLAVKIVGMGRSGVGRPVGLAYGWNTAGAILGSFIGGFVIVPLFGLQRAITIANGINWAAGTLLLGMGWIAIKDKAGKWRWPLAFLPFGIGALVTVLVPSWDRHILDSGPFMYAESYVNNLKERGTSLKEAMREDEIVFHKEGVDTTVSVMKMRNSKTIFLRVNGKTDASTGGDMPTQELVAHIPMLFHPGRADDVLVIGLASGVTAGSVTRYPIKHIDVVEISEVVVEASHYFKDYNYDLLNDPRVKLIIGDGRNHLKLTDKKYDVIISQPTNPWIAGLSSLFTKEYFESARNHLKGDGVFCCWLQAYRMRPQEFKIVMKTFSDVFPNATMWESIPGIDYILIGKKEPFNVDLKEIQSRLEYQPVKDDFKRINVDDISRFFGFFFMAPDSIADVSAGAEIHTDDRLQLEYRTPRYLNNNSFPDLYSAVLRLGENPVHARLFQLGAELPPEFSERVTRFVEARGLYLLAQYKESRHQWEDARQLYERSLELNPDNKMAKDNLFKLVKDMGIVLAREGQYERALELYARASELKPESNIVDDRIGAAYLAMGKTEDARKAFQAALKKYPEDALAKFNMGYIELNANNLPEAQELFDGALRISPNYPEALNARGIIAVKFQRTDEAVSYFERAIKQKPDFTDAYRNLGTVLVGTPRKKEGIAMLKRAIELDPKIPNRSLIEDAIRRATNND